MRDGFWPQRQPFRSFCCAQTCSLLADKFWLSHLRQDPVGDGGVAVAARRVGVVGQQRLRLAHGVVEREVVGNALHRHDGWCLGLGLRGEELPVTGVANEVGKQQPKSLGQDSVWSGGS
eukprot:366095-Chlamydomonas_euryale.AAC.8